MDIIELAAWFMPSNMGHFNESDYRFRKTIGEFLLRIAQDPQARIIIEVQLGSPGSNWLAAYNGAAIRALMMMGQNLGHMGEFHLDPFGLDGKPAKLIFKPASAVAAA